MAIDITVENFESQVIAKSHETPVLVDFWADWCSPCKALTPVLEKLEEEYEGRFILAKVDTQSQKELASNFSVTSIPNVKMIVKGEIKDEFSGAIPENMVDEFLKRNIPDERMGTVLELEQEKGSLIAARKVLEEGIVGEDAFQVLWRGAIERISKCREGGAGGDLTPELSPQEEKGVLKNIAEAMLLLKKIPTYGHDRSNPAHIVMELERQGLAAVHWVELAGALSPSTCPETLEMFLEKIESSPAELRDRYKTLIVTAFTMLDNRDPVPEFRKKLSRLLF